MSEGRTAVSLVAAMTENHVIGRDGGMPWHLPDDLAHFKRLTRGHTVIMGRKTFDEIRRPLPERRNVVITRNPSFRAEGVTMVDSLEAALALAAGEPEVFVIGGGEIYRQAMDHADRLDLTLIHATVEGDTWFPAFDRDEWLLTSEEHHPADARHEHPFTFQSWRRRVA